MADRDVIADAFDPTIPVSDAMTEAALFMFHNWSDVLTHDEMVSAIYKTMVSVRVRSKDPERLQADESQS